MSRNIISRFMPKLASLTLTTMQTRVFPANQKAWKLTKQILYAGTDQPNWDRGLHLKYRNSLSGPWILWAQSSLWLNGLTWHRGRTKSTETHWVDTHILGVNETTWDSLRENKPQKLTKWTLHTVNDQANLTQWQRDCPQHRNSLSGPHILGVTGSTWGSLRADKQRNSLTETYTLWSSQPDTVTGRLPKAQKLTEWTPHSGSDWANLRQSQGRQRKKLTDWNLL